MASSFSIGSCAYRVCAWDERSSTAFPATRTAGPFSDVGVAARFLRRAQASSYADQTYFTNTLRRLLDRRGMLNIGYVSDNEVIRRVAQDLVAGRLVVYEFARPSLQAGGPGAPKPQHDLPPPEETPAPSQTEPPATRTAEELRWIRFRVVDDETGERLANVMLTLTLPDGSRQATTTNADGGVYLKDLPDGACDIVAIDYEEPLEVRSVG